MADLPGDYREKKEQKQRAKELLPMFIIGLTALVVAFWAIFLK